MKEKWKYAKKYFENNWKIWKQFFEIFANFSKKILKISETNSQILNFENKL